MSYRVINDINDINKYNNNNKYNTITLNYLLQNSGIKEKSLVYLNC